MLDVKGVVYSIPCADCPAIYIGETGRTLKVHMEEHKRAVKSKDPLKELPCTSRRLHITSTGKRLESLQGRTIGEKEGSMRPLRLTLMLVYFWINHGPPLFVREAEIMRPEVSWQEAQTLFKEDNSSTLTAVVEMSR